MMAYASWSVVFGEQPSAAKWNILGTNDAAFNDGTGLPMAGANASNVTTSETTASTSYTALTTAQSFSVTVGSNGLLLVGITSGALSNTTSTASCYMTPVFSGANTLAAADGNGIEYQDFGVSSRSRQSVVRLFTGLTPGATTLTAQFRVGAGTGTFANRTIWAMPF